MFSTFPTKHGSLIIRTEAIRRLEDQEEYGEDQSVCYVEWWRDDGSSESRPILGTAAENFTRLKREEIEAIDAAQKAQARSGKGLPMLPIGRGAPHG